jgi:hypothetical protein
MPRLQGRAVQDRNGRGPLLFDSWEHRIGIDAHRTCTCTARDFAGFLMVGCDVERDAIPALNTLTGWEFGDVEKHIPRAAIRPNESKVMCHSKTRPHPAEILR